MYQLVRYRAISEKWKGCYTSLSEGICPKCGRFEQEDKESHLKSHTEKINVPLQSQPAEPCEENRYRLGQVCSLFSNRLTKSHCGRLSN